MKSPDPKSFREETAGKQKGLVAEFWLFIIQNKKWWLAPIIVLLVIVSALIILGGSGVAPFIYSLF